MKFIIKYFNSFWGSRCDNNQAHTISPKHALFHGDFGLLLSTHTTFHCTVSFHHLFWSTTVKFPAISAIFPQIQYISTNPCLKKLVKTTNFLKYHKMSRSFQLRKSMVQCKELASTLTLSYRGGQNTPPPVFLHHPKTVLTVKIHF